jgi:DNA-directed RNA polymerase subunit RPC12/RpoP
MKRKAIEKIEPAKTRKKGHIATVQTLDDIAIINVFNDKVLAVRYCINCKTGEHEYWTEKNGWKKGKLITAIEGNWYEWVWMKHDYKYPKIASEEDRKRLLDITQDKYCANDVWSRIDHMEYSYDYDIRQTAEHNRRAKINNFMIKAPKLPKDADEWFFEKTTGEDYMFKEKGTENFSCTNCGESFDRSELTPIHQGKKKATHNDMVRCPSCGKLVQVKTRTDHITAPPLRAYINLIRSTKQQVY